MHKGEPLSKNILACFTEIKQLDFLFTNQNMKKNNQKTKNERKDHDHCDNICVAFGKDTENEYNVSKLRNTFSILMA